MSCRTVVVYSSIKNFLNCFINDLFILAFIEFMVGCRFQKSSTFKTQSKNVYIHFNFHFSKANSIFHFTDI